MKDIDEALQLETEKELEVEIAERKELRHKMVGQLYPSILTDEIHKLQDRCWDIRHPKVLKT